MKNKRLANCESDTPKHSNARLKPGDVTWVKLRGSSWWPAQVVDENSVSRGCRPYKKVKTAVLLRLYGSYEYVYHVEPLESLSEFKNILEQQKFSCWNMIQKAMDHALQKPSSDRPKKNSSKSGDARNRRIPEKSNKKVAGVILRSEESGEGSKRRCKQGDDYKDQCESPVSDIPTLQKSPELSARRLKVMQNLGLIAPSGSPFYKNGLVQPMV